MNAVEILNAGKLKRTSCREGIINLMLASKIPLSESEISNRLAAHYDRTTFYRNFKILEEHKIIHKIVVDSQIVKYALDISVTHKNEHVHFYCQSCQKLQCLDPVSNQEVKLPEGYEETEKEILVKGTCPACKKY